MNKAGGIMFPDFKLYYSVTVIKTPWHWHKTDTYINGTEQRAQKKPHTPMVNKSKTKDARIYNGQKTASSFRCWENWTGTCKTMRTFPHILYKNNLKMD